MADTPGSEVPRVPGTLPPMTYSPPPLTLPSVVSDSGSGPLGVVHLLTCNRCDVDFATPFRDPVDRDAAAVRHVEADGHAVILSTEGAADGFRRAVLLRYSPRPTTSGHLWSWLCLAEGCQRWVWEFATGQLALAAFRGHGCSEVPA